MTRPTPLWIGPLFLSLAATAGAQTTSRPGGTALEAPASQEGAPTETRRAALLAELRERSGRVWQTRRDAETGWVRFLFGGRLDPAFTPRTDAEFTAAARGFLADTAELHGIELGTLRTDRVVLLPLALAGSSDKLTVRFTQEERGVPVRGASVNVLMDTRGRMLSVDTQALPELVGLDVQPTVASAEAVELALARFAADEGAPATAVSEPVLVIAQERTGKARTGTLAWEVELRRTERGERLRGELYRIAAQGVPRVVGREELVHDFDVFGNVQALVSPGQLPDSATNPPVAAVMPRIDVVTGVGTFTTDENGDFFIPGVNSVTNATIEFSGPYADSENNAGSDYSIAVALQPNVQNDVLMNPTADPLTTAEGNAFVQLTLMREWIKSVNPADPIADFVSVAQVNQSDLDCNATFDGIQTNYYVEANGCVNSAYSSVVHHEMGHFLNQLYGSGNASDGFGEGCADIWAMYMADDPIIGRDFKGAGTFIRTALNSETFCGDDSQGCQGQTHANGLPLMGAFWEMRENLNATYGNAAGDLAADVLLNAWFNAYDDGLVLSIIEDHLLTLDDDNGDLQDGTPNFDDIDDGFTARGWPGFQFDYVDFANTVAPANTLDELGPYGVAADLSSAMGVGIGSATVQYRVDGGPFQALAMLPTGGDRYTALIPGQVSPALVEYYLDVQDGSGNSETLPADVSKDLFSFRIGQDTVYWADSFDGPDDNGWTHVQTAQQDDWQRDVPTGKSGFSLYLNWSDPPAAFSPPNCWGNDLGLSGFNGSYQPGVDNALFSPTIDLSSASNTVLSFKRWLTVERGIYDNARIKVDGNLVWENSAGPHIIDTAWTDFEVDISAFADGNSAAQIEFQLVSDGGLEVGGWNIDDLEILSHDATPSGCQFTSYGAGTAGLQGVPTLDTAGQQVRIGNPDFRIALKDARPNSLAAFTVGFSPVQIPLFDGDLWVFPFKTYTRPTDEFGQAAFAFSMPNDPTLIDQDLYWQAFCADASLPSGWSQTGGITMTICN